MIFFDFTWCFSCFVFKTMIFALCFCKKYQLYYVFLKVMLQKTCVLLLKIDPRTLRTLAGAAGGTGRGGVHHQLFNTLYKNPLEIPKGIPS